MIGVRLPNSGSRQRSAAGFTIIELLVTVVLVSILAGVALPMASVVSQRNKEIELRRALREIRGALDKYKKAVDEGRIATTLDQSGYPKNLEVLRDGARDLKSVTEKKLVFLRRIPRDPFYPDGSAPAPDTWGKRSYASSAEEPKPGADIFDVYSLSKAQALNGTAYRNW